MAKRTAIASKELQLVILGARGTYKAARIQRAGLNTNIPSTAVDELGNSAHVGYSYDIPDVTLTFSAMDVGVRLEAALTGYDSSTWPGAGVDLVNLGEIDAIFYVKDPVINDYVKAAHARKLQIRDYTFNYTSDGDSTEDFTAVGSEKRWFNNDVVVETQAAGVTTLTAIAGTPVLLKNGNYLLTVRVKNNYLEPETTGTPAVGFYNYNSGTKVIKINDSDKATASDKVSVVFQSAIVVNTDWTDVSDTAEPVSIKGKNAKVYIGANQVYRATSLTINGTLGTQPVKELGNIAIVGYQKQIPEVTGNITVLDTDTEMISLMMYGVTASGTEFYPGGGVCPTTNIQLQVKMYDPCAPATLLKAVTLDQVGLTGDSFTSNVNQNASQTFNWRSLTGHCVVSGVFQ
jgi:hypothetical protein